MKLKHAASTLTLLVASVVAPYLFAGDHDCAGVQLATCPAPLDQKLPDAKKMLTWSQVDRVIGFRNDFRNYEGDRFRPGISVPLESADRKISDISYTFGGKKYNLEAYLKRQDVAGMLVLKDGKIAYKYLAHGNTDSTLWTSRSVGKSIVSTLVGVALKQGKIHSLDDLVTAYEPELEGTAWKDVSIRQLLQHTSGVAWSEDYTDPKSEFSKLTQCEARPKTYDCVRKIVLSLKRAHPAGQVWSYSSGGAWLLGDILEKATGTSIAAYLEKNIWGPYGMAKDGVWHSYKKNEHDVGAHGFNATLEDWARFGRFVEQDGQLPNGVEALPAGWFDAASRWNQAKNSITAARPEGTYGYQWWNNAIPANAANVEPKAEQGLKGSLWALGIFGQVIMVNRAQHLVIVQWSTWPEAEPAFDRQPLEMSVAYSAIAKALNSTP